MADEETMKPLATELVAPSQFVLRMNGYGALYQHGRSNKLRHVYFSRRLNKWFGVSSEKGGVRINHYPQCPCTMSV
jgi:hypothetical protein